ncbi:28S ribosomal protein S33, mitochondrial [Trichoplax sp. H2]|uniref:Small ribosomal subunit protein mS33 n=1 Tax=Trichoplax adhaerens TaxID=10228 RepID=B3RNX2_TRIAD|nr:expressed hypothetical protein [Trichoplax adhaerens]EDV28091.1 expressed hypothetical protein [Trichoplax adhaerens]RDD43482.1 28S ribosomal protein S33, mitochondrial [Trichoplax sp. H2]|eukprot:XP_002109925.1 expressed hypothetical protein [Trichoplax adhaerens]
MSSGHVRNISRLRAKIFGRLPFKTDPKSYKVVKAFRQQPKGPQIVEYTQPIQRFNSLLLRLRHMGLYTDEHLDFIDENEQKRRLKGKVPPKKGQGRRSAKKK